MTDLDPRAMPPEPDAGDQTDDSSAGEETERPLEQPAETPPREPADERADEPTDEQPAERSDEVTDAQPPMPGDGPASQPDEAWGRPYDASVSEPLHEPQGATAPVLRRPEPELPEPSSGMGLGVILGIVVALVIVGVMIWLLILSPGTTLN